MTRQDYILIAEALRKSHKKAETKETLGINDVAFSALVLETASDLAYALSEDNPRFNREHFLAVVRGEKALHSRPAKNGVRS